MWRADTVPPNIDDALTSSDVIIREGDNVTLRCKAKGSPEPSIKWKRDDGLKIVISKTMEVTEVEGDTLELERISRLHMGAYLCIATNVSPMVWIPHQLVGVPMFFNVTLECFIEANPTSLNYWTRENDHMITDSYKYKGNVKEKILCEKNHLMLLVAAWPYLITGQTHGQDVNKQQIENILHDVNANIQPCQSFFDYSCSNWKQRHQSDYYKDITGLVELKMNKVLVEYMETQPAQAALKRYYESCKKAETIQMQKYLQLVKPGKDLEWPILEELRNPNLKWPKKNFQLLETLAILQNYGLNNVLMNVEIRVEENKKAFITLQAPEKVEAIDKNSHLKSLAILKLLGVNTARISSYMQQVTSIEKSLEGFVTNVANSNDAVIPLTLDDLKQSYPLLNWDMLLKTRLEEKPENLELKIFVKNWEYFQKLPDHLRNQDKELLCNYLMIKFLKFVLQDMRKGHEKLDCVQDLRKKFSIAMNHVYQQTLLPQPLAENYKRDILEIFTKIQKTFLKYLNENRLNLLTAQVEFLISKLMNTTLVLPSIASTDVMDNYYKSLPQFDANNYAFNHLAYLKQHFSQPNIIQALVFNQQDPILSSSSIPYYHRSFNQIIFPHGYLQLPIYDVNLHALYKYSILGFILSHELMHAFDSIGATYHSNGLQHLTGYSILQHKGYSTTLNCIHQQHVTASVNERLADLLGARIAYDAYFSENSLEKLLPGTNLPEKRVFFLNLSQFFCSKMDINYPEHDDDKMRLHDILKNFEEFAETFQCSHNDKMHPKEKCRMW
uniref:Ig-like domain-containing protein n=1 Tax=Glossina austeni TaxID=7395 RepID=A0A1A9V7E4_GLOAU